LAASLLAVVGQSYFRGMYLGAIGERLRSRSDQASFRRCGVRYFKRMLGWTLLQTAAWGCVLFLALLLPPAGILLGLVLYFYCLTPYLIVLLDLRLGEALVMAPGKLRRYFFRLVPLGLLALFITFFTSLLSFMDRPFYGYYAVMLTYGVAGTWLIVTFMTKLKELLNRDGIDIGTSTEAASVGAAAVRWKGFAVAAFLLLLPLAGAFLANGLYFEAMDGRGKQVREGLRFWASGSGPAFYSSEMQYDTYEWGDRPVTLRLSLPDLSGGKAPDLIRGTAEISWLVEKENITQEGNTRHHRVEKEEVWSTLYYVLKKERSEDGSTYYSTRRGSAGILGRQKGMEPVSLEMTVSGNGRHVFLLQHPFRFSPWETFRMSPDGRFWIPSTNRMNPGQFQFHWFTERWVPEELFEMLAAKNRFSLPGYRNQPEEILAAALQEGDGAMVMKQVELLRRPDVRIDVPMDSAEKWSAYLRERYKGMTRDEVLGIVSMAGRFGAYSLEELPSPQEGVKRRSLLVPVGKDRVRITTAYKGAALAELRIETEAEGVELSRGKGP